MNVTTIQLPSEFYVCGRPAIDPNGEAVDYVTDGERFGLRFADGGVDWLGQSITYAFGDGAEVLDA